MAAAARVAPRGVIEERPVYEPLPVNGLADKVKEFILSRWTLVVAAAALSAACFGAMVGLGVAALGALVAAFVGKKEAPAPIVQPALNPAPPEPPAVRERDWEEAMMDRPLEPVRVPAAAERPIPAAEEREEEVRILPFPVPRAAAGTPGFLVEVFEQTQAAIREGRRFDPALFQHSLRDSVRVERIDAPARVEEPVRTVIDVQQATTFEMIRRFNERGITPLSLNMANLYSRGGGVTRGAKAQEEDLCRQSTLYPCLERIEYPLPEHGGAYAPGVQFFRNDNYEAVEPITSHVFTSAAYNCNRDHGRGYDRPEAEEDYIRGTEAKIKTMLRFAVRQGHRHLVLSALGCGAFRNNPETIAQMYRDILNSREFRGAFEEVAFGIYDSPRARHPNCPIFRRILMGD